MTDLKCNAYRMMALFCLFCFSSLSSAIIYEDAEDENTSRWAVYDNSPAGAVIENIYDATKNSRVISFSGNGRSNGYRLGHTNVNHPQAWGNSTQTVISWDIKYSETMTIYIPVQTAQGFRYLYYTGQHSDSGINEGNTQYIHHGIGPNSRNGSWQTFYRDLEADLQEFEPSNSILSINGFLIRGSGLVDNIQTLDELPPPPSQIIYENSESGTTVGWVVYDLTPTGATISNTFDAQKSSHVIELAGNSLSNGYRLGHSNVNNNNAWGNTFHKVISWTFKYQESFVVYIPVQTTLGFRYLYYTASNTDYGINPNSNQYIHFGLGASMMNGSWHTVTRQLQDDLHQFEPNNTILSVNGFLLRGSGKVDDILMKNALTENYDASTAARFLMQASFGPTEAQIDSLVAQQDLSAWIDQQILMQPSEILPYVMANSNGSNKTARHYIWWQNVMEADDENGQPQGADQLRQRMAFALSEIFVVSDLDYVISNAQYGLSHYYDMLSANSFGNYRDLLGDVSKHPIMGIYLSMVRNQKAIPEQNIRPDENYAREILQLFSIGLYELNLDGSAKRDEQGNKIPTYNNATVVEFARVFTGWNFADSQEWTSNDLTPYDKTLYMTANQSRHDVDAKALLNGEQLAAGQTAEQDLDAALDNIMAHENIAPFVSRLLIQRLTTSNPSPAYIQRVATVFNNNGANVKGDLAAVVKAILLDDEAIHGTAVNPDFGKVKEPLIQLAQFWRAFDAEAGAVWDFTNFRPYNSSSPYIDSIYGQAVLKSPSVFNFFQPNNPLTNSTNLSLVSPELQIMTEANIASANNELHTNIYYFNNINDSDDDWDGATRINISKATLLASDADELLDYLNKILLAGGMDSTMWALLKAHIVSLPENADGYQQRAEDTIFMIVSSPAFMIQK